MIAHTPVFKIMTRKPVVVAPTDSMESIRRIFEQKGFHHVPVVDQGKLVGVVSYTDYLKVIRDLFNNAEDHRINERLLHSILAKDVMATEVVTVHENDSVEAVVNIFKSHDFHSIPVIDNNRHLMGIITTNDLLVVLEQEFLLNR